MKRKVTFDHEVGCTYITLRKGKVARTQELVENLVLVDLDKDDNVLGVELLFAPGRSLSVKVADYSGALTQTNTTNVTWPLAIRRVWDNPDEDGSVAAARV